MQYQTTFEVPVSGSEVGGRIATCLARAGFAAVAGQPQRFKRGSLLSASFSFSPLKAPTILSVTTTPQGSDSTQVSLTYDVSTQLALVSEQDRAVWQADLEDLKQAILTGDISAGGATREATRAVGVTWRSLLLFFGVWLVVGLGIGIIGVWLTGNTSWSFVGIVVGCFVGYLVMQRYARITPG